MSYEFDVDKKDFYDDELYKMCAQDLEDQVNIRMIALDILKNWNTYRQSGNDIHQELLFSISELADFFYIRTDSQGEFKELLTEAHSYFQKNKGRYGYDNISYKICGNIYFCVPNLMKVWPIVDNMVALSVYYREKR